MKIATIAITLVAFLVGCNTTGPAGSDGHSDRKVYQGGVIAYGWPSIMSHTDTIPNIFTCAGVSIYLFSDSAMTHGTTPEDTTYNLMPIDSTNDGYFLFTTAFIREPWVYGGYYRVITSGCE